MDRVRIAEAFRLAAALGNQVWPGWDRTPFAVLLVTPDHEFLIGHPRPSSDFTLAGEDAVLKSKVWYRARAFPTHFLATFPAVGGVSTVVVGQAESTGSRTSTRWVVTLLHEHFHQLQDGQPQFYAAVDSLGLARGDTTGMWMLNYPFPYTAPEVTDHFSALSGALLGVVRARGTPDFDQRLADYAESRRAFRSMLQADDYRYFAFQVWREGIARYTEYVIATRAAEEYRPSDAFAALEDYRPFEDVAGEILRDIEEELGSVQLDQAKRMVVYSFGAAEGLILDQFRPAWRGQYFEEKFSLDDHFRMPN